VNFRVLYTVYFVKILSLVFAINCLDSTQTIFFTQHSLCGRKKIISGYIINSQAIELNNIEVQL